MGKFELWLGALRSSDRGPCHWGAAVTNFARRPVKQRVKRPARMRDDKFKDKTRLFQKKNQLFSLSPKNIGYSK